MSVMSPLHPITLVRLFYKLDTLSRNDFIIVLVAHNGFAFDFSILFAEVERRPDHLALSAFEAGNIHFSDTLPLLRQVCNY